MGRLLLRQNPFFFLLALACLSFFSRMEAAQYLSAGAEVYHMTRTRLGGTNQTGGIEGVRLSYDRIKGGGWYWGGEFLYAEGNLSGHNSRNKTLNSRIQDTVVEGRAGFTFQRFTNSFISPFVGYGYFHETNAFMEPSPILFTFVDTFNYVVAGFLSGVDFTPLLSMGVNIKVDFMLNGSSHVKNDPLYGQIKLPFKNEINTRVELPLTYQFCLCKRRFGAIVAPFYEFRHFGGQEGFPFDYIDTKFHLVGARFSLATLF